MLELVPVTACMGREMDYLQLVAMINVIMLYWSHYECAACGIFLLLVFFSSMIKISCGTYSCTHNTLVVLTTVRSLLQLSESCVKVATICHKYNVVITSQRLSVTRSSSQVHMIVKIIIIIATQKP